MSDLLTTKEACAHLNISKRTLYRWLNDPAVSPKIKRVQKGKRLVRWPRTELDRLARMFLKAKR